MVNIQAVFVANGAAILMLLILLFSSEKTIQKRLPDNTLFYIMVYSAIFQCVLETSAFVVDGKTFYGLRALALVLNSLSYINNIFFAFVWTMYTDYKIFANMTRLKNVFPFIAIPAVLIALGSIINLFVPVFFTVSAANIYQRTDLFVFPYAVTYIYLAYGVINIYKNRNKGKRYLFMPAILFMIPIILGSVLQFFIYGLSLVWIGVSISLISMYINVQNEVSYIDTLSGMFNRQYLNSFLETETHRAGQCKTLAGIMLDIDRFKSINDTYGHLTGDDAIRTAGEILHSCVTSNGFVSRFAGDEFVVILLVDNESEILEAMEKIKNSTYTVNAEKKAPYSILFSMGYSVYCRNNDSIDAFLDRMDSEMYKDKSKKQA